MEAEIGHRHKIERGCRIGIGWWRQSNKFKCKYFLKKIYQLNFFPRNNNGTKSFQCTPACTSTSYNRSTRKCDKCDGNIFIKFNECKIQFTSAQRSFVVSFDN